MLSVPYTIAMLFVAVAPPVTVPVYVGKFQLYLVSPGTIPFVLFDGVTTKPTPLQVTVVIAFTSGVGLIVTTNVKLSPIHEPEIVLMVYVAV